MPGLLALGTLGRLNDFLWTVAFFAGLGAMYLIGAFLINLLIGMMSGTRPRSALRDAWEMFWHGMW